MRNKNSILIEGMKIDFSLIYVPLVSILVISGILLAFPEQGTKYLNGIRNFLGNELGFVYILAGLGIFLISMGLAFSKYGSIKLGTIEKPRFSTFSWGAMIFTSTMAADILFYSLIEWAYYYQEAPFAMSQMDLGRKQDWASTYPLFHWGPIPWSIYILPAVAYAYMFFVKGRNRQRMSEACRPLLGKKVDGILGKCIDLFAIIGLLAGTTTTFSLTAPLFSELISQLTGIAPGKHLSVIVLIAIMFVFTMAVVMGLKGIAKVASGCVYFFGALLLLFFIGGPSRYIIETGVSAIGNMVQNFFSMATWMDPLRLSGDGHSGFPQNWTIFYWSYWIAWSVATPFFIGKISEGRTIKQTIIGANIAGLSSTFLSFIVFGGFGLYQQVSGNLDIVGALQQGETASNVIVSIFTCLPLPRMGMIIFIIAMVLFYASTFDALTLVISQYCYKQLNDGEETSKGLRVFWSVAFIVMPIAFVLIESDLQLLQALSICAAFPLLIILLIIIFSFLKMLRETQE
ncbi:MAG: BCCT family transporter [Cellulosilyticum sp.]|nr:BCCT family transporter [Cellulosilyticum sp.]